MHLSLLKFALILAPAVAHTVLLNNEANERQLTEIDLAPTCPLDTVSCQRTDVDPCCSPTNGLLVLALQWDTRWGPSDAFTVHGLWPDTCKGKQLPRNGCDPSRAYTNISQIIDQDPGLRDRMDTYWPSNKGDNNWFWTHEWGKHGTCVTTLHPKCYSTYEPQQEVVEYFQSILDLRDKYDVFSALNKSGIVPTEPETGRRPKNTYSLREFKDAVRAQWGFEPNVKCIGRRLQEVWLWFKVKGRDSYYPVEPWGADTCSRINYQKKI
ncbi:hypothetical protein GGI25_003156 [Coemansia spiralis]|uniref:ribonuclease T2 n=2 Tax=Coemansia TaxID=4863 RepID=A0A9W8KXW3_9FUNG|nr:ribonuclease T2-like protein [Coemansia spiralis]KAJ1991729.1 hypothetical protein EDC05_003226 [Coemansia umbellata]KAJ2621766.1 hypothetical protein GGI26_003861 [Coemansia sp. RSA 1358]KAJ2677521.1 hypothetical protein GGI25_003156 [Coemansia spiralis]